MIRLQSRRGIPFWQDINEAPVVLCSHTTPLPPRAFSPFAPQRPCQLKNAVMSSLISLRVRLPAPWSISSQKCIWLSGFSEKAIHIFQGGQHGYNKHTSSNLPFKRLKSRYLGERREGRTLLYRHFYPLLQPAEGNWHDTNRYGLNDLDNLSTVSMQAKLWILKHKS